MRFPPALAPFTNRITCIGTLSAEDRTTGPLDILIDVSNTAAHGMRGWVLGNEATRKAIERAQRRAARRDAPKRGHRPGDIHK
jgi:hypothetical protein